MGSEPCRRDKLDGSEDGHVEHSSVSYGTLPRTLSGVFNRVTEIGAGACQGGAGGKGFRGDGINVLYPLMPMFNAWCGWQAVYDDDIDLLNILLDHYLAEQEYAAEAQEGMENNCAPQVGLASDDGQCLRMIGTSCGEVLPCLVELLSAKDRQAYRGRCRLQAWQ